MANPTSGPNSSQAVKTGFVVAGVYNVNKPVLEDGQSCPVQVDINGNLETSGGGGGGGGNVNITGINGTPPSSSNPLPVELSDGTNPVGTAGNPVSVTVISDGVSTNTGLSEGFVSGAVPAFATLIGYQNLFGNLQVASPSAGLPVTIVAPLPIPVDGSGVTQPVSGTVNLRNAQTPASPANASVGVASAQILAANSSRTGLVLVNLSSNIISLGLGVAAVLNSGITLTPNGTFVMDAFTFVTTSIFAIASGASSSLAIQELS